PLKPVFLPFVHRAARHLSAYAEPAPWSTVGQVLDASFGVAARPGGPVVPGGAVVVTPSGRRVPIDEDGSEVLELTEQGFYDLRTRAGEGVTAVVASNVDSAESDLTAMDPKEIVAAAAGGSGDGSRAGASGVPPPPDAQERSQRLWWYLLCLGILVLGADTLISNRLSKT
ncbi:MAG: N-terminal double-transrane protein, partial [Acidobacteria bacterium]|nr:N-terminal double-transrane protein [Acidobacteriota bacterium]